MDTLLQRFERCELSAEDFGHAEHVKIAWLYLSKHPPAVALDKLAGGLRRLSAALGAPEKYHATITWAFTFLVHERMHGEPTTWDQFCRDNPDLLASPNKVLERYYTPEVLRSSVARQTFVMPTPRAMTS